jgi:hypothetical protein
MLQDHYHTQCRRNYILELLQLNGSPYCELIRRGIAALQVAPVLALYGNANAWRTQEALEEKTRQGAEQ